MIEPSGEYALLLDVVIASSIRSILSEVQAITGFAILDQVRLGGDAGIKSAFLGAALLGIPLAVRLAGSLIRRAAPFVRHAGSRLIIGGLTTREAGFAAKILDVRGGTLQGGRNSLAGIDGWLNHVPISIKQPTSTNLRQALLRNALEAETKALNAWHIGVELYIEALQFTGSEVLRFAERGPLPAIANRGIISDIHVLTSDGWIVFRGFQSMI